MHAFRDGGGRFGFSARVLHERSHRRVRITLPAGIMSQRAHEFGKERSPRLGNQMLEAGPQCFRVGDVFFN